MAAFWELYMFHYILINSSWLRKRDAKRRSHQGSPRIEPCFGSGPTRAIKQRDAAQQRTPIRALRQRSRH
jgi:hypothetical protein